MSEEKLKVVVFDDNEQRKKNIHDILPEYLDVVMVNNISAAKESIKPAFDGRRCNLVIMNADDNGSSLSLYDWMMTDGANQRLDRIPVLLLTEDEFSDSALSFLELGDVKFYEGEIRPDNFFITVSSILNEAEFMSEEDDNELSYTEKNSDRIYGMTIKPEGEDEDTVKRSVVYNNDEQLKHLDIALDRGRKKQEFKREIMEKALTEPKTNPSTNPKPLYKLDAVKVSRILSEITSDSDGITEEVRKTIVVVDYDSSNLNLCEVYLNRRYNVILLSTGMSAIDYFTKNRADLLLISLQMPLVDGTKILDSIRWQPNGKNVPAIFMMESNSDVAKSLCLREGVVGLLQKPVSLVAVKQAVEAVFSTGMKSV